MKSLPHILRTRSKRNRSGFTLVEIVIAATIFSIMALGIGSALVSGLKIWGKARSGDLAKADFLLTLEKFSEELRQSVDINTVGFQGSASEVSFPAVIDDSIFKIAYRFDSGRNMLMRKVRPITEKDMTLTEDNGENKVEEGKDIAEKDTLPLTELSFEYFYIDKTLEVPAWKWTDVWKKEQGIFVAVRLRGRYKDEEFARTVFIPIS